MQVSFVTSYSLVNCSHRYVTGRHESLRFDHNLDRRPWSRFTVLKYRAARDWIRRGWRWDNEEADVSGEYSFGDGVDKFNERDFYKCHDIFEELWNQASEPQRTLLHALLQASVGLYHLLNQNHRGAMVELGEGVSKLERLKLEKGPFHEFELETRALLDFLYRTQLENAACNEDLCVTMDGSQQSYQLLGNFGAGEELYELEETAEGVFNLTFCPPSVVDFQRNRCSSVKLPTLCASEQDLKLFVR